MLLMNLKSLTLSSTLQAFDGKIYISTILLNPCVSHISTFKMAAYPKLLQLPLKMGISENLVL